MCQPRPGAAPKSQGLADREGLQQQRSPPSHRPRAGPAACPAGSSFPLPPAGQLTFVPVFLPPQMDHDPRSPAYIATQGPLPATVADFWQVNLSKLTFFLKIRS